MRGERETDRPVLRWRSLDDLTPEELARFDEQQEQTREVRRSQPVAEIRLKIYAPEEGHHAEVYWEVRHPSEVEPYRFTEEQRREMFIGALDDARHRLEHEDLTHANIRETCVFCGRGKEDGVRLAVRGGGLFAPWLCEECRALVAPRADTETA